jgi:hypothetical protein
VALGHAARGDDINFAYEIRPILANACYDCHGPDESRRRGDLRLDRGEAWTKPLESGKQLVVPGNRRSSELWQRITSHNKEQRMPLAESGKRLTREEIERIGRWIEQGARWSEHWAYVPPVRPAIPEVKHGEPCANAIDRFIVARLEEQSVSPSPLATKEAQLRRLSLDLIGLPPTLEELESFLNDHSPDAYERVVDRLLASPRYGERMAQDWLDLARYGDTHGYHADNQRDMWRWREWVIDALNQNMPYDQFTVEQLAGDLLPNATMSQRIATGFHRNNIINSENGALAEEYRTEYVIDRVVTTGTVWLGQTWLCARCHDHKYDPISQRDFYRLFAYFNNVPENGLDGREGNAAPFIAAPSVGQVEELTELELRLKQVTSALKHRTEECEADFQRWLREQANHQQTHLPPGDMAAYFPLDGSTNNGVLDVVSPDRKAELHGDASFVTGKFADALLCDGDTYAELGDVLRLDKTAPFTLSLWAFPTSDQPATLLARVDDAFTSRGFTWWIDEEGISARLRNEAETNEILVRCQDTLPLRKWQHLAVRYDGSGRAAGFSLYINGKQIACEVVRDNLTLSPTTQRPWLLGRRDKEDPWRGMLDELWFYPRALADDEIARLAGGDPLREILAKPGEKRTPAELAQLKRYYLDQHDAVAMKLRAERSQAEREQEHITRLIPTSMVMEELPTPRDTFILERGLYDRPREKVTAGLPEHLLKPAADLLTNRLGLAKWLVDRRHPLTARVAVNRLWAHFFGRGLVATPEDFGVRGATPSHPELLDWLAVEFMESGWDVKHLVRLIVTSHAYRQSSHLTPSLKELDPQNVLLGRGPRVRLPAEMIRDSALAVSGLLGERIGGPSVNPYQPTDLWKDLAYDTNNYTAQSYHPSRGGDLYRRGLYTFWKRTSPHPMLVAFDAPSRETCTVARARTNSPLQALVLLNDRTFVKASRALAARVLDQRLPDAEAQVDLLFRLVLSRTPTATETQRLTQLYSDQYHAFRADLAAAKELLAVGEASDNRRDLAEWAAWTTVAQVLLNLEEFVMTP